MRRQRGGRQRGGRQRVALWHADTNLAVLVGTHYMESSHSKPLERAPSLTHESLCVRLGGIGSRGEARAVLAAAPRQQMGSQLLNQPLMLLRGGLCEVCLRDATRLLSGEAVGSLAVTVQCCVASERGAFD